MFSEAKFSGDISDWDLNSTIDVDMQRVMENSYRLKNQKDAYNLKSLISTGYRHKENSL
jgi:hypothetical protein